MSNKPCIILMILVVAATWSVSAQTTPFPQSSAVLEGNDMRVRFSVGGTMSTDLFGNPGFEVPKGSGAHTISAANLWLGGIDDAGQLRVSAVRHPQMSTHVGPGPMAQTYDSAYFARYAQVWKVTQAEIDVHIFNSQQAGYQMPVSISSWPGNGDTTNGEPWLLAPFVDVNSNSVYEPLNGDYPLILGTEAIYLISSDYLASNSSPAFMPMHIDIHTMAYVFGNQPGTALDQTLFVSHKVVSRSVPIHDVYVGQWVDFDLGNGDDDFLGCDTARQAFFAYNSDDFDDEYGPHPPSQAVVMLNRDLGFFTAFQPDSSVSGLPEYAQHYYGYLSGRWKNGDVFSVGGNGMGGAAHTSYLYSGDPLDSTAWSQRTSPFVDYKGKALGSIGSDSLSFSHPLLLDMAYVFAQSDTGDHLSSVSLLMSRIDSIRDFASNATSGSDLLAQSATLTSIDLESGLSHIQIFPNPTSDWLYVSSQDMRVEVLIYDLYGREVWRSATETQDHEIDARGWSRGMYVVELRSADARQSSRVMLR
ncbi:MAG: T9SS type A sorting domain-containing protein [Bacteroidia bacterium]|nr:T9SS type A sorting domain-containing protein [Bacteroidia bacterium]